MGYYYIYGPGVTGTSFSAKSPDLTLVVTVLMHLKFSVASSGIKASGDRIGFNVNVVIGLVVAALIGARIKKNMM